MDAYQNPRHGSYNSSEASGQNDSPHQQQTPTETSGIGWKKSRPEEKTNALLKALEAFNVFETPDELSHRTKILTKLNMLVRKWIKNVSMAKNMSKADAKKLGGKIYTFGSYRLGVHDRGANIYALCVAPRNIERSEFFTSFFGLLKKQPKVAECRSVENTSVPVIKMKFDGVEIDLLFARLSPKEIPEDFSLRDDNLLKDSDPQSVLSLNGCRVIDEIMELVPNRENFRLALRSIKLWAKKHGIYSNSLGFFGCITWAILVAHTCQFYPNATASTLVQKFFNMFSRWRWPDPVLLKRTDIVNLQSPALCSHLMPIITPAYPQYNSAFNVSEATKKVIINELNRGMATMNVIMSDGAPWDLLFEAPSFFYRYHHFIVVLVTSQTSQDQLQWCGLVQSKIRLLVDDVQHKHHMSLVHANPTCFEYKKDDVPTQSNSGKENEPSDNPAVDTAPFCSMLFIGLEFEYKEKNSKVDLTGSFKYFAERITQHAVNKKMLRDGMNIEVKRIKRKSLSHYLDMDFIKSQGNIKKSISTKRNGFAADLSTEKEVATKKRRLS
ncbi:poly(A) polymerase type 3-like [Anastrepha ludens]|uniref:poly(A) polymerase type 3-like n=1 Tax=Anastrepha ludens TaxID=28586 RepID=UPI0023B0D47B|nr:poly(A) polymerase type 3-like [Anastrepha ludens]